MSRTFVGARLRNLRSERGLSQARLAEILGISASYLNQIEHDTRPLTTPVLARITEQFGVDATFFSANDNPRLIAEIRDVSLDAEVGFSASTAEIERLVQAQPEFAKALVGMHRRLRNAKDRLALAVETRTGADAGLGRSVSMPHEEVRDFFYQRQNYLHDLDVAAESLTTSLRSHLGDTRDAIENRITERHNIRILRRVDLGSVQHRLDTQAQTLELSSHLRKGQQAFRMASELAFLEFPEIIDRYVDEGGFGSKESRTLARRSLANYFAAAVLLPYRRFLDIAEEFRYDIERLSSYFSVGYETICHRLSTMQRPEQRGVPFSFVRVDRAGNMSKRQSATGFHFTSAGGTCPLWNVYETFSYPGKIMRQMAQMPDGRTYLWISRTVEHRRTHFGQPEKIFAIGLGCELRQAKRLIYADGLNLAATSSATPIGAGCRVCDRPACPQRAFPPLNRELALDEHVSSVAPYLSAP